MDLKAQPRTSTPTTSCETSEDEEFLEIEQIITKTDIQKQKTERHLTVYEKNKSTNEFNQIGTKVITDIELDSSGDENSKSEELDEKTLSDNSVEDTLPESSSFAKNLAQYLSESVRNYDSDLNSESTIACTSSIKLNDLELSTDELNNQAIALLLSRLKQQDGSSQQLETIKEEEEEDNDDSIESETRVHETIFINKPTIIVELEKSTEESESQQHSILNTEIDDGSIDEVLGDETKSVCIESTGEYEERGIKIEENVNEIGLDSVEKKKLEPALIEGFQGFAEDPIQITHHSSCETDEVVEIEQINIKEDSEVKKDMHEGDPLSELLIHSARSQGQLDKDPNVLHEEETRLETDITPIGTQFASTRSDTIENLNDERQETDLLNEGATKPENKIDSFETFSPFSTSEHIHKRNEYTEEQSERTSEANTNIDDDLEDPETDVFVERPSESEDNNSYENPVASGSFEDIKNEYNNSEEPAEKTLSSEVHSSGILATLSTSADIQKLDEDTEETEMTVLDEGAARFGDEIDSLERVATLSTSVDIQRQNENSEKPEEQERLETNSFGISIDSSKTEAILQPQRNLWNDVVVESEDKIDSIGNVTIFTRSRDIQQLDDDPEESEEPKEDDINSCEMSIHSPISEAIQALSEDSEERETGLLDEGTARLDSENKISGTPFASENSENIQHPEDTEGERAETEIDSYGNILNSPRSLNDHENSIFDSHLSTSTENIMQSVHNFATEINSTEELLDNNPQYNSCSIDQEDTNDSIRRIEHPDESIVLQKQDKHTGSTCEPSSACGIDYQVTIGKIFMEDNARKESLQNEENELLDQKALNVDEAQYNCLDDNLILDRMNDRKAQFETESLDVNTLASDIEVKDQDGSLTLKTKSKENLDMQLSIANEDQSMGSASVEILPKSTSEQEAIKEHLSRDIMVEDSSEPGGPMKYRSNQEVEEEQCDRPAPPPPSTERYPKIKYIEPIKRRRKTFENSLQESERIKKNQEEASKKTFNKDEYHSRKETDSKVEHDEPIKLELCSEEGSRFSEAGQLHWNSREEDRDSAPKKELETMESMDLSPAGEQMSNFYASYLLETLNREPSSFPGTKRDVFGNEVQNSNNSEISNDHTEEIKPAKSAINLIKDNYKEKVNPSSKPIQREETIVQGSSRTINDCQNICQEEKDTLDKLDIITVKLDEYDDDDDNNAENLSTKPITEVDERNPMDTEILSSEKRDLLNGFCANPSAKNRALFEQGGINEEMNDKNVTSEERIIEEQVASEEGIVEGIVERQDASKEEILEGRDTSEEEILEEQVGSQEGIVEAPIASKEEMVEEQKASEEEILEEQNASEEGIVEDRNGSEEPILEGQGESEEEIIEEQVASGEGIVEGIVERQDASKEEILEGHDASEEEILEEELKSEEGIVEAQDASEEIVEEQDASGEGIVEEQDSTKKEMIEEQKASEERIVEDRNGSEEQILEGPGESEEEIIEQQVTPDERIVEGQDASKEEILEGRDTSEEEILVEQVGSQEGIVEDRNGSEEPILEGQGESEEEIIEEQVTSEERIVEGKDASGEGILEGQVESEEEILEGQGASEEKMLEVQDASEEIVEEQDATKEEILEEEVESGEGIVEGIVERQDASKEEMVEEQKASEEEILEEQNASEEGIVEDRNGSEEPILEDQGESEEEIIEEQVTSDERIIEEQVASGEGIVEGIVERQDASKEIVEEQDTSGEGIVEEQDSTKEEMVEEQKASEEGIVEDQNGSEEPILEGHGKSEEEIREEQGTPDERIVEGQEESGEENGEGILDGQDASKEEILEEQVETEKEMVEEQKASEERIVEDQNGSEEPILEGHGESEEEIREEQVTPDERIVEGQEESGEENGEGIVEEQDTSGEGILKAQDASKEEMVEEQKASEEGIVEDQNGSEEPILEGHGESEEEIREEQVTPDERIVEGQEESGEENGEGILDGQDASKEEILEEQVETEKEMVEEQKASEERIVEDQNGSEEPILEGHGESEEEIREEQVIPDERIVEGQEESGEENGEGIVEDCPVTHREGNYEESEIEEEGHKESEWEELENHQEKKGIGSEDEVEEMESSSETEDKILLKTNANFPEENEKDNASYVQKQDNKYYNIEEIQLIPEQEARMVFFSIDTTKNLNENEERKVFSANEELDSLYQSKETEQEQEEQKVAPENQVYNHSHSLIPEAFADRSISEHSPNIESIESLENNSRLSGNCSIFKADEIENLENQYQSESQNLARNCDIIENKDIEEKQEENELKIEEVNEKDKNGYNQNLNKSKIEGDETEVLRIEEEAEEKIKKKEKKKSEENYERRQEDEERIFVERRQEQMRVEENTKEGISNENDEIADNAKDGEETGMQNVQNQGGLINQANLQRIKLVESSEIQLQQLPLNSFGTFGLSTNLEQIFCSSIENDNGAQTISKEEGNSTKNSQLNELLNNNLDEEKQEEEEEKNFNSQKRKLKEKEKNEEEKQENESKVEESEEGRSKTTENLYEDQDDYKNKKEKNKEGQKVTEEQEKYGKMIEEECSHKEAKREEIENMNSDKEKNKNDEGQIFIEQEKDRETEGKREKRKEKTENYEEGGEEDKEEDDHDGKKEENRESGEEKRAEPLKQIKDKDQESKKEEQRREPENENQKKTDDDEKQKIVGNVGREEEGKDEANSTTSQQKENEDNELDEVSLSNQTLHFTEVNDSSANCIEENSTEGNSNAQGTDEPNVTVSKDFKTPPHFLEKNVAFYNDNNDDMISIADTVDTAVSMAHQDECDFQDSSNGNLGTKLKESLDRSLFDENLPSTSSAHHMFPRTYSPEDFSIVPASDSETNGCETESIYSFASSISDLIPVPSVGSEMLYIITTAALSFLNDPPPPPNDGTITSVNDSNSDEKQEND